MTHIRSLVLLLAASVVALGVILFVDKEIDYLSAGTPFDIAVPLS